MSVYVIEYCVCLLGRVCFHLTVPLASLCSWEHQTRPTCQKSVFSSLASALHLTFKPIHKHLTIHLNTRPSRPGPFRCSLLICKWVFGGGKKGNKTYIFPLSSMSSALFAPLFSQLWIYCLIVAWGSVGVIVSKNGPWLHEGNSAKWVSGWARNFKRDKMKKGEMKRSQKTL